MDWMDESTHRILLFGDPAVVIGGKLVNLGKNADLLVLLIVSRHSPALDALVVDALYHSLGQGDSEAWARQRRSRLLQKLGVDRDVRRNFKQVAALLTERFSIDMIDFEAGIAAADPALLRRAVDLRRRGPLAGGLSDASGIIQRERERLDGLYAQILGKLIDADRTTNRDGAIACIADFLGLPHISAQDRRRLTELRNGLAMPQDTLCEPAGKRPRAASTPVTHRIPVPLTRMIGRKSDLDFLKKRVRLRRFVTITGPGGIGKSRLAVAILREMRGEFRDGVWFVDLRDVGTAEALTEEGLAERICLALNVEKRSDIPWSRELKTFLGGKDLLLILDECERCREAAWTVVSGIAASCPRVALLATSRDALGPARTARRLNTLNLPSEDTQITAETLAGYEAVQLFVERAGAFITGFSVTEENSEAVLQVCRSLDGLPLALELAAALIDVRPLSKLAADLQFSLLQDETGLRPSRHSSLQVLLDSHYERLPPPASILLSRLSIFRGGFDVEAAAVVAVAEDQASLQSLLDLLEQKSLVTAASDGSGIRYRLLNTIRADAAEKLRQLDLEAETRERHCDYYLTLAEHGAKEMRKRDQLVWIDIFQREYDNMMAALEGSDGEKKTRMVLALWRFWSVRGYLREAQQHLEALLAAAPPLTGILRAQALNAAGHMAYASGAYDRARMRFGENLAIGQKIQDDWTIATALFGLGIVEEHTGHYSEARPHLVACLNLFERLGEMLSVANTHYMLAVVAQNLREFDLAEKHQAKSFTLFEDAGDLQGAAKVVSVLGNLAYERGDYVLAEAHYRDVLQRRIVLNDRTGIASARNRLGLVARADGRYADARRELDLCREEAVAIADKWNEMDATHSLAMVDEAEGRIPEARVGYERARDLCRAMNVDYAVTLIGANLGVITRKEGRLSEARRISEQALRELREIGDPEYLLEIVREFAYLARAEGAPARCATLAASHTALLRANAIRQPRNEAVEFERMLEDLRAELSTDVFDTAWERGSRLSLDETVALLNQLVIAGDELGKGPRTQ